MIKLFILKINYYILVHTWNLYLLITKFSLSIHFTVILVSSDSENRIVYFVSKYFLISYEESNHVLLVKSNSPGESYTIYGYCNNPKIEDNVVEAYLVNNSTKKKRISHKPIICY